MFGAMGIMPGEHDWMKRVGWGGPFGNQQSGSMGVPGTTPASGSWADRLTQGMQSPGAQLGLRILANNRGGQSLGNTLGLSAMQMQQQSAEDQDAKMRRALMQAQIDRMNQPAGENMPSSYREWKLAQENPGFADWLKQNATAPSQPASLQEWQAFQGMSPEQQKQYLNMKRQPAAPQVVNVGGVPTLVDRLSGQQNPLSSLQAEIDAMIEAARGKARGALIGEGEGGLEKKAITAQQVLQKLDMADSLIDIATGSATGAAADKVAAFFGKSTDGAEANAQLKVLQADLMTTMPRMEGPQSDRDVQLYREASAQLGDPTIPRAVKKAALSSVRAIQEKYAEGGSGSRATPGASQYQEGQTATNPQTGQKLIYRNGQWVAQ